MNQQVLRQRKASEETGSLGSSTSKDLDPESRLALSKSYWQHTLKGFNAVFTPAPGQTEFNPKKSDWEFKPPWIKDDPIPQEDGKEYEDRSSGPIGG